MDSFVDLAVDSFVELVVDSFVDSYFVVLMGLDRLIFRLNLDKVIDFLVVDLDFDSFDLVVAREVDSFAVDKVAVPFVVDTVVDNFVVPWEVGSFVAGKVVVPWDTAFAVEQVVDPLALDESFDS